MNFEKLLEFAPNQETQTIFAKGTTHLSRCFGNIACAISGGSDSDIMLDILTKLDDEKKIQYVFFDTGIEYQATKKHLDDLEGKYQIKIERVKAIKPVPLACKQYGVPFMSKYISEMMSRLQKHGFKWEDEPFEVLLKKYPKCKGALRWWCNDNGENSSFSISRNKMLKEFIVENPPDFAISSKCCDYAKKMPSTVWCEEHNISLLCLGVRKSEGGIRSTAYKSCFSNAWETNKNHDEWRPLFWLKNEDKQQYKEFNEIQYSDCYEVYGLKRTGCFGCPFGSAFEEELKIIEQREPNLFLAANNIFGKSYEYMRKYRKYKEENKCTR